MLLGEFDGQGATTQIRFKDEVNNMCATIRRMGNPFMLSCPELLVLDTRNCVDCYRQ